MKNIFILLLLASCTTETKEAESTTKLKEELRIQREELEARNKAIEHYGKLRRNKMRYDSAVKKK